MNEKLFEDIFSIFENHSNSFKRNNQYFDILYDSTSSTAITKTRSDESVSISDKKIGIVARTYTDRWYEVAIENFENLDAAINKLPRVSDKGELIKEYPSWQLNERIKPEINPDDIPLKQKIEKVREFQAFLSKYDERIVNPMVAYAELLMERIFVNNEGCRLRQVIPKTRVFLQPIVKEGNVIDFDYFSNGGNIGFEIFKLVEEQAESIVNNSLEMLKAKPAPSGKHPIILDPDMAGLIAHESFGHGLEADQILRDRSYLKPLYNKKVASDICVICDDASIPNKWGSYFFDEEGIKSQNNLLVENGILKNYIYNRESASKLDAEPKGNGRRESYAHPVHPRMTNTYFKPGDHNLDEMISEIKYGVILERGYFGMEDPLGGGLQCTSKKGYLIENGEKTQLLKSVTLSGSVLDLLNNIDAISKDDLKLSPGTCGKGSEDMVPVTSGGAYIRVKKALISSGG